MENQSTEQAIQAVGANAAPRVTLADIEANIVGEYYFTAKHGAEGAYHEAGRNYDGDQRQAKALGLLTFCVLVLRNGFTVTGESSCVSPENFNAEIGRKVARDNAVDKLWPLLGYELKSRLASAPKGASA